MCRFRYDAKYSDEDGPSCDEEGTKDHPERKYITKDEAGEERVPQKRNCTKWGKNDDREGGDLDQRPEDIGRDEDDCKLTVTRPHSAEVTTKYAQNPSNHNLKRLQ